eukprot:TRINITY_DN6745_c0_g1_i1.p1 TRINITY_DN6745_c0_g1~~TRINITY_DN6745_c0_g1_i1.p1  ORF type:complete len:391 (-),score=57.13 TRINITY_DN6745_c0_g1_i1:1179-2351(-)
MSLWAVGFVIVRFDIEFGPTIDGTFPSDLPLSEYQKKHIKFMAFPDSSAAVGDMIYSFRFPIAENLKRGVYGYAVFRQQRDVTEKRGYLQKSLVLLSMRPYVGLFEKVMSIVGPLYFQYGIPLLECAWNGIQLWTPHEIGDVLELPFLGHVIKIHLPSSVPSSFDARLEAPLPKEQPLNHLPTSTVIECSEFHQDSHIYINFSEALDLLPCLWEIVLTGQPLLLITSTPVKAAQSILALASLIAPCPCGMEYRPYYTIHDATFQEYSNKSKIPTALIGVTNPFFLQAMNHWPNTLLLSFNQNGTNKARRPSEMQASFLSPTVSASKTELRTKSTFELPFDRQFIKRLVESDLHRRAAKCDELLRKHFRDLTEKFLVPLDQHFQSLMPLAK